MLPVPHSGARRTTLTSPMHLRPPTPKFARHALAVCASIALQSAAAAQVLHTIVARPAPNAGHHQLGRMHHDGTLALRAGPSSLASGPISTMSGLTALHSDANRVFWIARTDGDGSTRVFTIDGTAGTSTSAVLNHGAWDTITGLAFDPGDARLSVVVPVGGGGHQVGTLDPASGLVALLGTPISGGVLTLSPGVVALDATNDRLFCVGRAVGAASSALFAVDTVTGAATATALSGVGHADLIGMAYDPGSASLVALAAVGTGRQLVTIDPASGIAAFVGASTIGGAGTQVQTLQGVTSFDPATATFWLVGRSTGAWRLWSVDATSGLASASPLDESTIATGGYAGLEYPTGCRPAAVALDPGCPGGHHAGGGPLMSFSGIPALGTTFRIHGTGLLGQSVCGLLIGLPQPPVPLALIGSTVPGSALCVDPFLTAFCVGSPAPTRVFAIPAEPAACSVEISFQWVEYAGTGLDFGTSQPALVTIGP